MAFSLLYLWTVMPDKPLLSLLQDHQILLAAPLSCASYGGLAPVESADVTISSLRAFGFELSGTCLELRDGRPVAVWSDPEERLSVAFVEDTVDACCYVIVAANDESELGRLAAVLRRFLPLVEMHSSTFDPFGHIEGDVADRLSTSKSAMDWLASFERRAA